MKIVIDTNVFISGIFFGGNPQKIIDAVFEGKVSAFATTAILAEYQEIIDRMVLMKKQKFQIDVFTPFVNRVKIIETTSKIDICRDPDDNKFIECAKDAKAMYIVSGDNDLLDIKRYEGIKIVTAKEFYDKFLQK